MRKLVSFLLVLCLAFGCVSFGVFDFTVNAAEIGQTGSCIWMLDGTVLTIKGNGSMGNYIWESELPWGKDITEVIIENGVTSIGTCAFFECSNLVSVTIPNSVLNIGSCAFENCKNLTSVVIPGSVKTIGKYSFALCNALTSVSLSKGLRIIDECAFSFCKNLDSVIIPDSVETIGMSAFSACEMLSSVVIPDSVTSIGSSAFISCRSLKKVALPNSVTTISNSVFSFGGIKVIYIPKEITLIEENAFVSTDIDYVFYGGSVEDKLNLTIGANNDALNHALWEYNSTGLPECEYDNEYDDICNVCQSTRNAMKDTSKIFTDVKSNSWYRYYVDYAVAHGIFTGTSKTEFSPNSNITRAQFVQVLANINGIDTSSRNVTTSFTDVPKGKWYTHAVKWASENKIVNGVGNGKFDPNANVTREQMCVMLVNYAKFMGITLKTVETIENFADDSSISKWAKTAVYTCQQADIVNGKGANTFDPQGTGTRAEACVMFTKFHEDYMTK